MSATTLMKYHQDKKRRDKWLIEANGDKLVYQAKVNRYKLEKKKEYRLKNKDKIQRRQNFLRMRTVMEKKLKPIFCLKKLSFV